MEFMGFHLSDLRGRRMNAIPLLRPFRPLMYSLCSPIDPHEHGRTTEEDAMTKNDLGYCSDDYYEQFRRYIHYLLADRWDQVRRLSVKECMGTWGDLCDNFVKPAKRDMFRKDYGTGRERVSRHFVSRREINRRAHLASSCDETRGILDLDVVWYIPDRAVGFRVTGERVTVARLFVVEGCAFALPSRRCRCAWFYTHAGTTLALRSASIEGLMSEDPRAARRAPVNSLRGGTRGVKASCSRPQTDDGACEDSPRGAGNPTEVSVVQAA